MSRVSLPDGLEHALREAASLYAEGMANELKIEEVMERARLAQEDRMAAIRVVAEARQSLLDVQTQTEQELSELRAKATQRVAVAEREDVRAYNASLTAGWTVEELKKIGFGEPVKKTRARRRSARKTSDGAGAAPAEPTGADGPDQDTPSDQ